MWRLYQWNCLLGNDRCLLYHHRRRRRHSTTCHPYQRQCQERIIRDHGNAGPPSNTGLICIAYKIFLHRARFVHLTFWISQRAGTRPPHRPPLIDMRAHRSCIAHQLKPLYATGIFNARHSFLFTLRQNPLQFEFEFSNWYAHLHYYHCFPR